MSNVRKFIKHKQVNEIKVDQTKVRQTKVGQTKVGYLKRHITKLLVIIIFLAVIAVGIKIYFSHSKYSTYKVVETVEASNLYNETKYIEYGSYFLRYSNDGLSYVNGKDVIWNQAFELKNPLIDICGDYVVIGEQKSNELYLFDTTGLVKKLTTTYPIMDIEVSKQGVVATLLDINNVNYLEITDKEGEKLVDGESALETATGYPIDLSISDDGLKLIMTYLYINEGNVESQVIFRNFSEVGQNEENRLVGGFNYKDTIVPKVQFLSNTIACAFGDNMFSLFSIKEKPKLIVDSELFKNEIKSIFYSEKYIGLVFNNDNTKLPYIMHIYNTNGKQVLTKEFDFNYTDIKFAKNNILLYNNTSCELYNFAGVLKFSHTFDEGIVYMTGTSKSNRYIIANTNSVKEIKLK